jgi:hypothetical protein
MNDEREDCLAQAVRAGSLVRYVVHLERGEHEVRRLWLRPEAETVLRPGVVEQEQLDRVKAAFRRFVLGGLFNVVSKECEYPGALTMADIRELKTVPPPFFEMRFRPPKHDLRVFGRFVCKDGLVLTSKGLKSLTGKTSAKPLRIPDEFKRCSDFFTGLKFRDEWIPQSISESVSNAKTL